MLPPLRLASRALRLASTSYPTCSLAALWAMVLGATFAEWESSVTFQTITCLNTKRRNYCRAASVVALIEVSATMAWLWRGIFRLLFKLLGDKREGPGSILPRAFSVRD